MKKNVIIVLGVLFLVAMISGCSAKTSEEEKITISIGHASSESSTTQIVCEAFAEKLIELLGEDRVEVVIYPNATIGSEAEMVEALQMGNLDAATFGRHSAIDERLDVLNLPFLFQDDEHVEKVLRGEEGEAIRETLYNIILEHDIVTLGWYETGFREITSNKKIETLEDMEGLLIRTPSTDTLLESFTAWGASPTAVDLSELYTALKTKVVDAQENPYQLIDTYNLYEVQKYLCVTDHLTIPNQLVFSETVFDTYPEDVQTAIREAGEYACNVGGEYNIEQNNALLESLSTKMEITHMDDDSLEEMKQIAMEEVWPLFVSEENETAELVNEILAIGE